MEIKSQSKSSYALWVSKATHRKVRVEAIKKEMTVDNYILSLLN